MTDQQRETPDAGQGAGGEGRVWTANQNISGDSIAPAAIGADPKDLLPAPDPDAAVDFLEGWRPGGPWVLTAIEVDPPQGREPRTPTTTLDDPDAVRRWVRDHSGGTWNLYFTVNVTRGPVRKKPKKANMAAATALHVDVDPRAGEPLDAERERAERLLRSYNPAPTVIIDSGGGFQGFWKLREAVDLPGEPDDVSRHLLVEERNLHIGTVLQGDACHNIDRVMRLPGTVNWPSAKKRKKGRKPALARVVDVGWTRLYGLDEFPRQSLSASSGAAEVNLPAELRKVHSLDSLPPGVSDRTRMLIVNGNDPDDPAKYPSRSEVLFAALCEMVRAGVSDEVMASIILDPDYGISSHVLEQPRPRQYAERQIQRALAKQPRPGPTLVGSAMDWARAMRDARRPHLLHHHEEFLDWDGAAYVSVPEATIRAEAWRFLESCQISDKEGALRPFNPTSGVVSMVLDALKAISHLPSSREEPPRWLDGRTGPDPLALLPTRSGLLHLPTGELMPATPELFTRNALDFLYDPAAPSPNRWLSFLHEVWPDADEADCISALQEFMGYLLTPDTSLQKALLIPGPKRSGKGTIGRIMTKLVGEANTVAPSLNSFGRSDFGLEPLLAKQLAIVSDMRLSGRTDEAAVAENLLRITGEDRVSVNRKHRQALEVTLRTRFVVFTNEVPKFADRSGALVSRFIVLPMRQSFYGREDPGLTEALMAELPGILKWAMEGWRRVRATGRITQPQAGGDVALQMTDLSSPIPAFVREWCEVGGDYWVPKERLFGAFRGWHQARMGQDYMGSATVFARDLYSVMDGQVRDYKRRDGSDRLPSFAGIALRAGFGTGRRNDDVPF